MNDKDMAWVGAMRRVIEDKAESPRADQALQSDPRCACCDKVDAWVVERLRASVRERDTVVADRDNLEDALAVANQKHADAVQERDEANQERDHWRGLYLADHERFPGALDDKSKAEIAVERDNAQHMKRCAEAQRDQARKEHGDAESMLLVEKGERIKWRKMYEDEHECCTEALNN